MIQLESLPIKQLTDYDQIGQRLSARLPRANHSRLIDLLKQRLGLKCGAAILEYPYRDYDFSSVFTLFYAKKHVQPARDCIRLHLFSAADDEGNEPYIGFCVVRDSRVDSRGRAVLDPAYLMETARGYLLGARLEANLLGLSLQCVGFPSMAQDTDIAVCAHVAVWTIVNYYGHRYPDYRRRSIGAIAEQVPRGLGRKVPSEGLNLLQISELLADNGFFPLILQKQSPDDQDFFRAVFSYIESGIPMVAAMTKREHAVTIVGHGALDNARLTGASGWIFHSDLIDELIVVDDNHLPYTCLSRGDGGRYSFDDLDFVIIPLYEKMYINANIVHTRVRGLLESGTLAVEAPAVVRIYLTSTRSLKRKARADARMNAQLKDILLRLELPRFVWCADIATPSAYARHETCARVIIDATAGTYEVDPWLLWHDAQQLYYRSGMQLLAQNLTIAPYPLYRNNLLEVARK